ncbi:hypothetical protein F2P44_04040 [Massilia sp. CCM 8695]|uniref:Bulb-type lectin domain-containing protein n=1 Tax=Massilia frigida TaxID=2609281 RepID=A0ABX0N8V2_9BURK|nr:hypothetical protein [Massilia frigida]NHZ78458.1 hypothetical protein [Massilia frigida]
MRMKNIVLALGLTLVASSVLAASRMGHYENLQKGQYLQSPGGAYSLMMQTDGSLVMYRRDGTVRYSMGKHGQFAAMQGDGNFVLYSAFTVKLWQTNTAGQGGMYIEILDDGNLRIMPLGPVQWPVWEIGAERHDQDPTQAGDIVGRDLDVPGAGFAGHIGLWDGTQVYEAMGGQPQNAIRTSSLNEFKSASKYWGKTSPKIPAGLQENRCYLAYCTNQGYDHRVFESRVAIAQRAAQIRALGADYTLGRFATRATWASETQRATRGTYRCDTFVLDLLIASTAHQNANNEQAQWSNYVWNLWNGPKLPLTVFDAFR